MQESIRRKFRRLLTAPAIIGWLLVIKPIIQVLASASDIDFYISASGNPRMVAIWHFFATPSGNIVLIAIGFMILAYLVVRPEKQAPSDAKTPPSDKQSPIGGQSPLATSEPNTQEPVAPQPEPNLVSLKSRLAKISPNYKDGDLILWYETFGQIDTSQLNAAVVDFGNEIKQQGDRISKVTDLRAQMTYYNTNGDYLHRVNKGQWLMERSPHINLGVGNAATLVLIYRQEHHINSEVRFSFNALEDCREEPERGGIRKYVPLAEDRVRAQVSLLAGEHGDLIGIFNFNLTLRPTFSIERMAD
jgi:hypothetical protein